MNNNRSLSRAVLILLPAALGTVGFLLSGSTFLNALFVSVTMYAMEFSDPPPNLLVELARWTAPIAAASGILLAINSVKERLRNWFLARSSKSIAVYGDEEDQDDLLGQIGKYGIRGKDKLVRASQYILAGSEQDNMNFYEVHQDRLKDHTVYLRCRTMSVQASRNPRVKFYSAEETAARLFWKKHCLYARSVERGHRLSVVLLGFGRLGEELLYWGLQENLFSPDQRIEYHVFGDCDEFLSTHPGVAELQDVVVPHDEPWYHALDTLRCSDLIVILDQEHQIELPQRLLLIPELPQIVCFASLDAQLDLFGPSAQLEWFVWQTEANRIENIMEGRLLRAAKAINLHYAHLYSGVEENEENLELEWEKLDAFLRYSNISSADYHEVRLKMLEQMGVPADYNALPPDVLELLAELEHNRWCSYHYLNNWRWGEPADGKRKDTVRRIHRDLIWYRDLPESEKEKDRANIQVLLEVK